TDRLQMRFLFPHKKHYPKGTDKAMEENGGHFLKTGVQNTKNRENMGIEPLRCAQTPYKAKRHAA
ncbi:hypothetical protein, partial [Hominenteromicrobium sp.]|uniref:hypothetical protein n=1 Tax=Hominenteromicrobium sp. TaxID=3073581 RepID=UPI003AEFF1F0